MNSEMQAKMKTKYAIVALTDCGKSTALTLQKRLTKECPVYTTTRLADNNTLALQSPVTAAIASLFTEVDVLICIMATGIVVRSIAPVVMDKQADPAVIVMDEKAQNVISLLSGHLGGANAITHHIAAVMGANPVITTATDVQGVVALDTMAQSVNAWHPDLRPLVKYFNSLLSSGKTVYCYQEKEWLTDTRGLTMLDKNQLPDILDSNKPLILLSLEMLKLNREHLAILYPKPYLLGVGARKDISQAIFQQGFLQFCRQEQIDPREVAKIVSIDLKQDETAILALAEQLHCPFETYSKEELLTVADKYPQSSFVKKTVGVGSVALASADLASQGQVLTQRFAKDGCTYALAKMPVTR